MNKEDSAYTPVEITVNNVQFVESPLIRGIYRIQPKIWGDNRGYFFESYSQEIFEKAGITNKFVQDNQSYSTGNVVRGLHFQLPPYAQAKLVRVISGEVLDVALDIRPDSPTFGKYEKEILTAEKNNQFFIPSGFAHGFKVLSDKAIFAYKCDNLYNGPASKGIFWNDPELNIDWNLDIHQTLELSEKDLALPIFSSIRSDLEKIDWNQKL